MMSMQHAASLIIASMPAQREPLPGGTGFEVVLLILGAILTLGLLGFFIFLFVRSSKEEQ